MTLNDEAEKTNGFLPDITYHFLIGYCLMILTFIYQSLALYGYTRFFQVLYQGYSSSGHNEIPLFE